MSETVEVKTVQKLYSLPGYLARFYEILQDNPKITQFYAYELLENEFELIFGVKRYASYDSFRMSLTYRRNKAKIIY